jgi:hypothetical protein
MEFLVTGDRGFINVFSNRLLAGDVGSWVREAALLTGRQLLWLSVTTSAATDAAAVSHFCACIGSPCLRHCGHGASIGRRRRARGRGSRRPWATRR